MKIPVLGMDPSLTHWGLAESLLDLTTGIMDTPHLEVIVPKDLEGKQIRVNSNDLHRAEQLAEKVISAAKRAKVIFVECPVGSQSARSMASYGICVGILGSIRGLGIQLIEVTAKEAKEALSGNRNASKKQMIEAAVETYPDANFPMCRGRITNDAEHVADAIGSIFAGVNTPTFRNLMRLLKEV